MPTAVSDFGGCAVGYDRVIVTLHESPPQNPAFRVGLCRVMIEQACGRRVKLHDSTLQNPAYEAGVRLSRFNYD